MTAAKPKPAVEIDAAIYTMSIAANHAETVAPPPGALGAALARIEREVYPIDHPVPFKQGVRALIRRAHASPSNPAITHLFRRHAARMPIATLDTAIEIITRETRNEIERRILLRAAMGSAFHAPRIGLQTMKKLYLILRFLRAHAPESFEPARDAVLGIDELAAAAK